MRPLKKVVIFLPLAKASVDVEFFTSFSRAKTYLNARMEDLPFDVMLLEFYNKTFPIDANRDECAHKLLEGIPVSGQAVFNPDFSIWIDTDHTLPEDTFFTMLKHDRPIILGVYYIKAPKAGLPYYPVLFRKRDDRDGLFKACMEFPKDKLFEVDMAGMGAACIKREVFEKLEPPFFKYMLHPKGSSSPMANWKNEKGIEDVSEDVWFWKQVREKTNYPILVDPNIQFGHIGRMIFDQHMYNGYLGEYKRMMLEKDGEEFERKWAENAVVKPYVEVKL